MQLIRQLGILYEETNAIGELAFQKAATGVWRRRQAKKDKVYLFVVDMSPR